VGAAGYDLINCQFALHYAFSSFGAAEGAFLHMVARLSRDGRIILTIPNADYILANIGKSFWLSFLLVSAATLVLTKKV
jgi:hypothetical protein